MSYLGVGVPPPAPDWGRMIHEGKEYFRAAPWIVAFPGMAIFITVLGFNLLGDGLRNALDPHKQAQ
jgi:peptide/nickel transport system permease protein